MFTAALGVIYIETATCTRQDICLLENHKSKQVFATDTHWRVNQTASDKL